MFPSHVIDAWDLQVDTAIELTGGRSNLTYRCTSASGRELVVQRLAAGSHSNPLGVMENLFRVTSHLDWKRITGGTAASADSRIGREPGDVWYPLLVPTQARKPFMVDAAGDLWRAFAFRPGVIARTAQSNDTVESIAAVFGRFLHETSDLDGPPLIETTAGFHDLSLTCSALEDLVANAPADQKDQAQQALSLLDGLLPQIEQVAAESELGQAVHRTVHNDTKLANVLLDPTAQIATGVLDLDLVMAGPAWHDFGDLVRSASWHADSGAVPRFDPQRFHVVLRGFVRGSAGSLDDAELATFAAAGPRIAFELGARYLADHFRDTPRLAVSGENGHLRRGEANLRLADEMLGAYDALRRDVEHAIKHRHAPPEGFR